MPEPLEFPSELESSTSGLPAVAHSDSTTAAAAEAETDEPSTGSDATSDAKAAAKSQPPTSSEADQSRPKPQNRKRDPAVRRSKVSVAIGFVGDMQISIAGARRTLSMNGPDRATMRIKPGVHTVRWGPAGKGLTRKKTVEIVEGVDYQVNLGADGPLFDPVGGGAP